MKIVDIVRELWLRLFQRNVTDSYFMRYIKPEVDRAKALGIPSSDIRRMWEQAVEDADPNSGIGVAARLTNLIDQWHFRQLIVRAREIGVPQYVFEHTWQDAIRLHEPERGITALGLLDKFLTDWKAGNVYLL